jgi:protein-S-isoprenylcysteine O-methyltransferase Ste14
MTFAGKTISYVVLGMTGLLGGGTLFAFMLFLYIGPFELVKLGLGESTALWLNSCLCLAFFLQHSLMIRRSFRKAVARFLPAEYDAAFFSIASGIVLLLMLVFWQESAYRLGGAQGTVRLLLRGVYLLSFAGFIWGMGALGVFDPFGLIPILDHLRGKKRPPVPFVVRGPYRWVRHPLYMFLILMFWSYPDLTADRLLFNVLWTGWMIVGTVLEERDLLASFGDAYRDYQTEVPMLIPCRLPLSHGDGGK